MEEHTLSNSLHETNIALVLELDIQCTMTVGQESKTQNIYCSQHRKSFNIIWRPCPWNHSQSWEPRSKSCSYQQVTVKHTQWLFHPMLKCQMIFLRDKTVTISFYVVVPCRFYPWQQGSKKWNKMYLYWRKSKIISTCRWGGLSGHAITYTQTKSSTKKDSN